MLTFTKVGTVRQLSSRLGRAAGFGLRLRQAWGKVRRFYLSHFAPGYVERQQQRRRGHCRRCGGCCELLFRCPHLRGTNECAIYGRRYLQCRLFPIDERDLAEVEGRCGFRFEAEG